MEHVMPAILSKVSVKSQTVIPGPVRERLGLKAGDSVRYTITPHGIVIDRAPVVIEDDPFAVFHEWSSAEDEEAWKDL
jgi:antitoxin PrlF